MTMSPSSDHRRRKLANARFFPFPTSTIEFTLITVQLLDGSGVFDESSRGKILYVGTVVGTVLGSRIQFAARDVLKGIQ